MSHNPERTGDVVNWAKVRWDNKTDAELCELLGVSDSELETALELLWEDRSRLSFDQQLDLRAAWDQDVLNSARLSNFIESK